MNCTYHLITFHLRRSLGAKVVCSHVTCGLDSATYICPLCDLPCCLCGGSSGLPPGVVCQGDPETSRGEEHPGAERGEEAGGASGYRQHPGPQPEGETGVHAPSGSEQEPTREELTHCGVRDSHLPERKAQWEEAEG